MRVPTLVANLGDLRIENVCGRTRGIELQALRETNARAPDLVLALHWLTTADDNAAGMSEFYR
jgi:hypothetical protein